MSDLIDRLDAALDERYTIKRELGAGSLGTVYLAYDRKAGDHVALRVLSPDLAEALGAERFENVCETIRRLRHPSIVPVLHWEKLELTALEGGTKETLLLYVMPYVLGGTLRDRLNEGPPLGVAKARTIAGAVARALQNAHEQDQSHRDLRPENVFMPEGLPVMVDFGTAFAFAARSRIADAGPPVRHPEYKAPEQAGSAAKGGPPSDIYALAVVLHEMLRGQPPNGGGEPDAAAPPQSPPSGSAEVTSIPANVGAAIQRALREDPDQRFTSAHDFATALWTVARGEFPFPLTPDSRESPYLTWIRNRSNYLGVGGITDYARAVSALVRGVIVNLVVLLPHLLLIALAIAAYEWLLVTFGLPESGVREWLPEPMRWSPDPNTRRPIQYFVLTLGTIALAVVGTLLGPVLAHLRRIRNHGKSLESGSESSIETRDRNERWMGYGAIVIGSIAALESLRLLRDRIVNQGGEEGESLVARLILVAVLSLLGAFPLLSMLKGSARKVVAGVIGLLGLFLPTLAVLYASYFISLDEAWQPLDTSKQVALDASVCGETASCISVPEFVKNGEAAYVALGTLGAFLVYLLASPLIWMYGLKFLSRSFDRVRGWKRQRPVSDASSFRDSAKQLGHLFGLGLIVLLVGGGAAWGNNQGYVHATLVIVVAFSLWLFARLTIDVNLSSIHGFYRDRLASAFLIGEDTKGDIGVEQDLDLAEICRHEAGSTAPYHLINAALNLQGSEDVSIRDRKSDFFIFSKKFIGGERTGYCRSEAMERVFPEMGLSTAMAISAAAAAPNMGKETSPALTVIMALLNLRLGFWLPNPGLLHEALEPKARRVKRTAVRLPGLRFEELFEDELDEIRRRWAALDEVRRRTGQPSEGSERSLHPSRDNPWPKRRVAHNLFGIALSGGGIRSATLNLGMLQALHARGVFDHFDYMSTVSGGGFLGSSLSALMRHRTPTATDVAGTVKVEAGEGRPTVVYVRPTVSWWSRLRASILRRRTASSALRRYEYAEDARLVVRDGDRVKSGQRLLNTRGDSRYLNRVSVSERLRWRVKPRAFIQEMLGRLHETGRWVNVSDGGHLENLAVIELLRRRCRYIIVGDGEEDRRHAFKGLATLMRLARIDLGIEIEIDLDGLRLAQEGPRKGLSEQHWAIGRIKYPGEDELGYLLYLKSSVTGDRGEDEVIREYRHNSPGFPHESTADQFFTEGQFEAYRSLGQHIGEEALNATVPGDERRERGADKEMTFADVQSWFARLVRVDEHLREARKASPSATSGMPVG